VGQLYFEEGRRTSDAGFYTLAESAATCALERDPESVPAQRLRLDTWEEFHRFADVAQGSAELVGKTAAWEDWARLGDARMELGQLDPAADAYQAAVDLNRGPEVLDRIGWIRWLWGDFEGAVQIQERAAREVDRSAGSDAPLVLTHLAWFHYLAGKPTPELDEALALLPGYRPALYVRGRMRLHAGDKEGAKADLVASGPSFFATQALAEIDPTVDPAKDCALDRRSCAIWLADHDPPRSLTLFDAELKDRQDATTRAMHAYARYRAAGAVDARIYAEAFGALDSGTLDPQVLVRAGIVLGMARVVRKGMELEPGLLPSERALAEQALATLPAEPPPPPEGTVLPPDPAEGHPEIRIEE
jgi:tetratricopeptide (TPR) repeat protein